MFYDFSNGFENDLTKNLEGPPKMAVFRPFVRSCWETYFHRTVWTVTVSLALYYDYEICSNSHLGAI